MADYIHVTKDDRDQHIGIFSYNDSLTMNECATRFYDEIMSEKLLDLGIVEMNITKLNVDGC